MGRKRIPEKGRGFPQGIRGNQESQAERLGRPCSEGAPNPQENSANSPDASPATETDVPGDSAPSPPRDIPKGKGVNCSG